MMHVDTSKWSGEGEFTQLLVDRLQAIDGIAALRVEDAPATRSDANYNFISNEVYIVFAPPAREGGWLRRWIAAPEPRMPEMTIGDVERVLAAIEEVGAPDYSDEGMLQYLRAERIIPPYQTRGYKLVELVRIYDGSSGPRDRTANDSARSTRH